MFIHGISIATIWQVKKQGILAGRKLLFSSLHIIYNMYDTAYYCTIIYFKYFGYLLSNHVPKNFYKNKMKAEIKPAQRNLEEFAGSWRSQHGIINYMALCIWCFLREIYLVLTGGFIQVIQISLFYIA